MSKKKNRGNQVPHPIKREDSQRAEIAVSLTDPKALGGFTLDAFSNLAARLGYASGNLLEATNYENTRLTRDFQLLVTLYRSNWLTRKIIDLPAEDMLKNWYQVVSDMSPDQLDKLQKVERRTKTRAGILQGLKWGRLFGGGACIIIIKGHEDRLDTPLDLADVMPGSYKGLIPLDRWSGITPTADLIDDLSSPDFGLPEGYRVTLQNGTVFEIHSSRVLRFQGRDLPSWEKAAEMQWGVSEIEIVFDELRKRDNTSFNIAGLVFLANIRVLTLPNIAESLALAPGQVQQQLYNILEAQNRIMSSMGMMVLPKDGQFNTHAYSFSGLNEIYESFMLDCAGAAEIPVTKLFGRSPAGMNATGESDLQNYYDGIEQKQEADLRPQLEKLLPIICTSTFGAVPDDLDFKFPSPQNVPSDKLAEVAGKKTDSICSAYNAGLISQKVGMKELKQMEDETGLFSNITEEDIAKADDTPQGPGEMGGMGGGLEGLLGGGGNSGGAEAVTAGEPDKGKIPAAAKPQAKQGEEDSDAGQFISPAEPKAKYEPGLAKRLLQELKNIIIGSRAIGPAQPPLESLRHRLEASKREREQKERFGELEKSIWEQVRHLGADSQVQVQDGWIGVDLDGTLAEYHGNFNPNVIGKPVPKMVARVRKWLAEGLDVRICTARVYGLTGMKLAQTEQLIGGWLQQNIGQALPITCQKDHGMEELWDDRAVGVKRNTGELVATADQLLQEARAILDRWEETKHPRDDDGKFATGGSTGANPPKKGRGRFEEAKVVNGKRAQANGDPLPAHIEALKLPPAWTDVRWNSNPDADLLAIGRDAKGRDQYVYSKAFQETKAAEKFARVKALNQKFAKVLAQIDKDREDPAKREAADCLKLVLATGIRPGSDVDTQASTKAFGATTLEARHIQEEGGKVTLSFIGKKGVQLNIPVEDKETAKMLLARKRKLKGNHARLFDVNSDRLLAYSKTLDGGAFKPKDFRTHLGTQLAIKAVKRFPKPASEREYKKAVKAVAERVAKALGNTPTVALQSYISPAVFAGWRSEGWK